MGYQQQAEEPSACLHNYRPISRRKACTQVLQQRMQPAINKIKVQYSLPFPQVSDWVDLTDAQSAA